MRKNYDSLSIIVRFGSDYLPCPEDEQVYNQLVELDNYGEYEKMYDILQEWDYGDACEEVMGLDEFDDVVFENDRHILSSVNPLHFFGGHLFVLYRKEFND